MEGSELARVVERAAARNLLDYVEALQSVAPGAGAGAVECAGGIAAFTGLGSPLTMVKGAGPEITAADIEAAETYFRDHGVRTTIFETAPWISDSSLSLLSRRGYAIAGSENVLVRRPPFDAPEPGHLILEVAAENWATLMLQVGEVPEVPAWGAILTASALLPGAIRLGVDLRGEWIACAQVQPAAGIAIFGNDATLRAARGQGAQTATIRYRLRLIAGRGYMLAVTEVAPGSSSERNYLRHGFELAYRRARYARPNFS